MTLTDKRKRSADDEKIHELMLAMDFIPYIEHSLMYRHECFGNDIIFDLSASGSRPWQIMSHVFKIAIKFGEDKKLAEIQNILGITNGKVDF